MQFKTKQTATNSLKTELVKYKVINQHPHNYTKTLKYITWPQFLVADTLVGGLKEFGLFQ